MRAGRHGFSTSAVQIAPMTACPPPSAFGSDAASPSVAEAAADASGGGPALGRPGPALLTRRALRRGALRPDVAPSALRDAAPRPARRGRALVWVVDGTLSSREEGEETHCGRLMGLLEARGRRADVSYGYHPGVQGQGARRWLRAALGLGLNDAIVEGYARLASQWAPGDRIFLFGYSRGAYAVRSLAGLIGRVGLLRPEAALERRVIRAFRLYQSGSPEAIRGFARRYCHPGPTPVRMIGVWDTVKALGAPWPVLSFLHPMATEFHDHRLSPVVRNGFQALALDEDRIAFAPEMWERAPGWGGRLEQVWFPGAHADVGGQVGAFPAAAGLAAAPFQWMMERAEELGMPLPDGWRAAHPVDPAAPMMGPRKGIGRLFLLRAPRRPELRDGQRLHETVAARAAATGYAPSAALAPEMQALLSAQTLALRAEAEAEAEAETPDDAPPVTATTAAPRRDVSAA
ncbi:MAG: hypothetical protein CML46_14630 [Rhodobacteraceae bacterium]|nr:hypothetical protein [Paracoccaceae bacterium]